jgi:uncharacterized protein YbgA (DUF1722 family)/uncharacterized protein YbbK (DUF523 family)
MRNFLKPKIILSSCLNLEPVRYNGKVIRDPFIIKLREYCEIISVCPEVSIGLGVPRDKIIVYKDNNYRIYQPNKELDLTKKMIQFSENFLSNISEIDGFLLKSKSPSCGVSNTVVYKDKYGKEFYFKGRGLFAMKVLEKFPFLPIEDERRLRNKEIRERFLIRIFALSELREMKSRLKNISELMEFHQNHKYLIMAFSLKHLKIMGNLIGNYNKEESLEKIKNIYSDLFKEALSIGLKIGNQVNTIIHIFGHFSKRLKKGEKIHFLTLLEKYRNGRIEIKIIREILKNWAYRFEDKYILNQTYLEPYPEELNEI